MTEKKSNVTFLKNKSHFLKKSRELRSTISSMQPNLNEAVEITNFSDNMAIGD